MRGVVGDLEEERPLARGGGVDDLERLVGQAVGEVLARLAPLQVRDVAELVAERPAAAIGVEEGLRGPPERAADVDVEPLRLGIVRRVAQVPLADQGGQVSGRSEDLGDRDLLERQVGDRGRRDELPVAVGGGVRAASSQIVIPSRAGCLPVIRLARVGEQTDAAYACVNRTPCAASRSMCGVSCRSAPWHADVGPAQVVGDDQHDVQRASTAPPRRPPRAEAGPGAAARARTPRPVRGSTP